MNTNAEQDALLKAIFAFPEEDTPRLVYADWLDEHGEPEYAEFIRLQIEQTKHREWSIRQPLEKREREVWKKLKRKWRDLFEPPVVIRKEHFRRGFAFGTVEELAKMPVETFVKLSGRFWPRVPLQRVCVNCTGPIPDAFFECPYVRRLTRLSVTSFNGHSYPVLREESVIRLFSCDPFDHLVALGVHRLPLSQPIVDALRAAPYLGRLRKTDFDYVMNGDAPDWGALGSFVFPGGTNPELDGLAEHPGSVAEEIATWQPRPENYLIVPPGETSLDRIIAHTRAVRR